MISYVKDNTFKCWIFDSGIMVHVCFQNELFNNSLVAIEKRIIKMVDGLTCKVIGTGTVKVTVRDGTVHVLKAV